MIKSLSVLVLSICIMGCVTTGTTTGDKSASQLANEQAAKQTCKPIVYANASLSGPEVVVLPGEIKTNDASFPQKITLDNIADYAELELVKANFKVLERNDLGALLQDIQTAASLGDPAALAKVKAGKFKSAKWFVKFDILRADPVASAKQGFDGQTAGALLSLIPGVGGAVASTAASSAKSYNEAAVWTVGMRYKIIDACSCEQIGSDYVEDKMEIGCKGTSFLGVTQAQENTTTLNTIVQHLVQLAVADIDQKWKSWTPPAPPQSETPAKSRKGKGSSKKSSGA
jgi:hypothetical protein